MTKAKYTTALGPDALIPKEKQYPRMDDDPKKHKNKLHKVCIYLPVFKQLQHDHFFIQALLAAEYDTIATYAAAGGIVKLAPKTKLNKDLIHIGYEFYKEFLDTKANTLELVHKRKYWKTCIMRAYTTPKIWYAITLMLGAITGKYTRETFKDGIKGLF
jgi:hypothetical protein